MYKLHLAFEIRFHITQAALELPILQSPRSHILRLQARVPPCPVLHSALKLLSFDPVSSWAAVSFRGP